MSEKDLKVKVVYRDRNLDPTYTKTYDLQDYTDMLRMNLIRIITDVEDLVYITNENKSKDDWEDSVWVAFQHIKHKLLDNAGSIQRIPQEIILDGDDNGKTTMDHPGPDR